LVGAVAGLAAIAFQILGYVVWYFSLDVLAGYRPYHVGGEQPLWSASTTPLRPWLLLVLPAAGGLLSGLLVYWLAPEASGHGTDAAIDAYHRKQGAIRPLVAPVKLVASAITIGTGGSGGREGPIAQIGAGFGSLIGNLLRLTVKERRVLMIAGMGAGVGAIFRAPLAGALFASEVLYRNPEFESEVIVPAGMASAIAYAVFAFAVGFQPLFDPPDCTFSNPMELFSYLLLALMVAGLASVYTRTFYLVHDRFARLKLHPAAKPAIGGILTGVVGVALYGLYRNSELGIESLSVFSYGYGILQKFFVDQAFRNTEVYALALLLIAIALGKIVTTALTIGSGGSGGVFGPSMVIGGCAGGALGLVLHQWFPQIVEQPAAYMLVGMAGFFSAAGKVPFSTILMVSEMTGNYALLPPALWVCVIAYLVSDSQSLFRSQVSSHWGSPAHRGEYVRAVLANVTVDRLLNPAQPPLTIRLNAPLSSVVHDLDGSHSMVLPVVDEHGAYLGMVSLEEVHLAAHSPAMAPMIVAADLMRDDVVPLYPGDTLYRAMELFGRCDVRALPIVVHEKGIERVIGVVRRSDLQAEYLKHVHGTDRTSPAPSNDALES
jgi:CIC family chloride channel protein